MSVLKFHRFIGAALATGFLTMSSARAATLEERVQQLENRLANLVQENAALKEQLGARTKDQDKVPVGTIVQGKETKLAIGGYIQANAEFGNAPDSRFPATDRIYLRRARLGVKGTFAENVEFTLQSEFGNNSIGGVSGYRAQITDCLLSLNRYPAAVVAIGQFKTPYGYEQLVADTKSLFVERSLPNDRLTLSRQIGAMVSGFVMTPRVTYAAGLFNGNGVNNGANDNDQFLYVGRLTGTVVQTSKGRVGVGVNGFSTRDTGTFTGHRTGLGFDLQASFGPAEIQTEYLQTRSNPEVGADSKADGWSVLGSYMIVPKKLQGLLRYEVYDPSTRVAADQSSLWTVGFNYFLKGDDLKVSLNYLIGDPAGPLSSQGRLISRFQVIY